MPFDLNIPNCLVLQLISTNLATIGYVLRENVNKKMITFVQD